MRKLLLAGLAVASLTAISYAQGGRPSFTPLPWYPDGKPESLDLEDPDPSSVRLAQSLAALQGVAPSVMLDRQRAEYVSRLEKRREQLSALAGTGACELPDKTTRPVNTKVVFNGFSYLCVEVLDRQLARQGLAWTRVAD